MAWAKGFYWVNRIERASCVRYDEKEYIWISYQSNSVYGLNELSKHQRNINANENGTQI